MLQTWIEIFPSLLVALGILLVPGIIAGIVLKVRLFDSTAIAPLISISIISLTAIASEKIGLPWTPVTFGGAVVLFVLLCFALRFTLFRDRLKGSETEPSGDEADTTETGRQQRRRASTAVKFGSLNDDRSRYYFAATIIGALIIGGQCLVIFGTPSSFSQTFDNVFHLNAVRYILDTSDASSLTLTSMTTAGEDPYFYPAAWHAFAALIIQSTGVGVTAGVTTANLVISAVIWPLSCLFAIRQFRSLSRPSILVSAVIVAAFGAFPILLLDFGVLYPNLLSLSMVPAGLALVAASIGLALASQLPKSLAVVLCVFSIPGIAVAHPNGLMTLVALSIPLLLAVYLGLLIPLLRKKSYVLASLLSIALVIVVFGLGRVWEVVRPPAAAATWNSVETSAQAMGEALLNAPFERPAAWAVSVLVVIGLTTCLRDRRLIWLAGAFAVSTAVFVVAAGVETGEFRSYITGVWYNDPYRLAAIAPITAVPLAIIGFDTLVKTVAWHLRDVRSRLHFPSSASPMIIPSVALALTVLVAPLLLVNRSVEAAVESAKGAYIVNPDSALVSSDELELIDRLDETTHEDATIAVNPWTGAALAYALADRNTTYKHILSNSSASDEIIDQSLKDGDSVPGVCAAVASRDIEYVLDFGTKEVHGGNHRYPGLEDLASDDDFRLIDQVGEAKLYEFIGCP